MHDKYLDSKEVGKTEFNNFFDKLEHSITTANMHGIMSNSEYEKCWGRLVKKFLTSLEKGSYKSTRKLSIGHSDGDVKINRGDIIELIDINKPDQEVTFSFGGFRHGMRFDFMLNFEPAGEKETSNISVRAKSVKSPEQH